MTEGIVQDAAYENILKTPGIPLANYRSDPPTRSLFPDAIAYPDFFNDNLVNDNRIIKQFLNNTHSNIRVFYFQLFRLGFQIETENNQGRNLLISFRRLVFYPEFEILFTHESQSLRDVYNNVQFKRFFAEFLEILGSTPNVNVEKMINTYPIIDQVMIHILRSILLNQGINEEFTTFIPTQTVFGEFSSIIGLSITSYGNCWKFEDSDMFCYQLNERAIYLAYIVEGLPVTHASAVHQMVSVNYYQDDPLPKVEAESRTYLDYLGTQTVNSQQLYQPSIQLIKPPVTHSVSQPSYLNSNLNTNYGVQNKYGLTSIGTSLAYTDASLSNTNNYSTSNYSTNNYSLNYNSPPVQTQTYTTSTTPYVYDPVATLQKYSQPYTSTTTEYKSYSLSSYVTPSFDSNERKSMTLIDQKPYGSGSNTSYKQSNPAKESMISEYFQFEAFTGQTTIQKMKVPRSQAGKQSGIVAPPVIYYSQGQQFNSMKFGDFGGLTGATSPPQPATPIGSLEKSYEFPSYTATTNQYASETYSPSKNVDSVNSNLVDTYLHSIGKYSSHPEQTTITYTENKYTALSPAPASSYEQTSYKSSYGNYDTTNTAHTASPNPVSYTSPYSNSYSTSFTAPQTAYTSNNYSANYQPTSSYGLGNYETNTYSVPNSSYTSYGIGDTYSYTPTSTQNKSNTDYLSSKSNFVPSYSAFATSQDNNFYSNNPYVKSSTVPTAATAYQQNPLPASSGSQTDNQNPYLKDTTSSTDYLSRYGISSPTAIGEQVSSNKGTFEQSYGIPKQETKASPFERTSASQYKPSYIYPSNTHQAEQKPSSSYDRYNYQTFSNPSNQAIGYGLTNYNNADYKTQLSNSSIYNIINRVKPAQKPQTAVVYSQPAVVKPVHVEREVIQYQHPASSVGAGYAVGGAYVYNYRA